MTRLLARAGAVELDLVTRLLARAGAVLLARAGAVELDLVTRLLARAGAVELDPLASAGAVVHGPCRNRQPCETCIAHQ